MKNILLVGFSPSIIMSLDHRKDINIFVIEEKNIFVENKFDSYEAINSANLKKVIFTEYMNSNLYEKEVEALNLEYPLTGVLPVKDYAVRTAGKICDKLNLLGIPEKTCNILTNKILLRDFCKANNIPHPKYKKINSIDDLRKFYSKKDVIFKPANRQGSLGISKITKINDIENAWINTINAEEGSKHIVETNIKKEFIAEEFIGGYEVSIETIVKKGDIIFNNITSKISLKESFVEEGHIVPGNVEQDTKKLIEEENLHFIKCLGIKNGLLHSEWKIENGKAFLIECAGRTPGDYIPVLISKTYDFNFFEKVCDIYLGIDTNIPNIPQIITTSHFFIGYNGILRDIRGIDYLKNNEKILRYMINVNKGDIINDIKSSWDRLGYFITYSDSYEGIEREVSEVTKKVEFVIEGV